MKIWTIFFLTSFYSFSQTQLQKNVDEFIGVDVFENYYYLKDGALYKSNIQTDYKNIAYRMPNQVDISNPLQVILYYRFFNKAILLDNKLNFISEFNIPIGTTLIANAGKDKIWLYNNMNNLLSIYNFRTNKTENTSISITEKITALKGNLNEAIIKTQNNKLDIYNFFARKTRSKNLALMQLPISMNTLYSIQNNQLYKNKTPVIKTPNSITSFEVQNKTLYYFKDSSIFKTPITE